MEHIKGENVQQNTQQAANEIGDLISTTCQSQPDAMYNPHLLAEAIVDHAVKKESGDNISVQVIPLKSNATGAIFDGHGQQHGGNVVSNALRDKFNSIFLQNVNQHTHQPTHGMRNI